MKKFVYILFLFAIMLGQFSFYENCQADTGNAFEKNAIRIVKKIDEKGKVKISYIFPVNSEFFENNFSGNEISVYKFYLANYVLALAKTYKKKEIENVFVSNCEYYVDIDGFGFSIFFENQSAQNKYFGQNGNDKNDDEKGKNLITEGVFVKKSYIKTTFPVVDSKSAGDLKMVCVLCVSSWAKECEISEQKKELVLGCLSKTKFIYDFSAVGNYLKSDCMYTDGVYTHNVFIKSQNEIEEDNEICFWVSYVDKGFCYLFVTILVVLGVIMAIVVLKIRKKL